jgi:hypothetical protein
MPSWIAEAIGISETVEINEAIVMCGSYWVVGAIGLTDAYGMLGAMSIPSTKNNWNTGETLLSSKSFNHHTIRHLLHAIFQSKKHEEGCIHFYWKFTYTKSFHLKIEVGWNSSPILCEEHGEISQQFMLNTPSS